MNQHGNDTSNDEGGSLNGKTPGILWLDCIGGIFVGVCVLIFANQICKLESLPLSVVVFMGIANLVYGLYSLFVTTRRVRHVNLVKLLACANMAWLLVCLGVAVTYWNQINGLGLLHVLGEGAYVFLLGLTEWRLKDELASRDQFDA